jgi:hypothetical protein
MKYYSHTEAVEARVRKEFQTDKDDFDISFLLNLLKESIDQRQAEWDAQAEIGWRIRNNELPLREDRKNFEQWKDKYFKDNWVSKSIKLKNSYLLGGDIFFDLRRLDGSDIEDPMLSPLENEINFSWIHEEGISELVEVMYDLAYTGVGVSRTIFDPYRRTQFWDTGRISYEHIDSRNIFYLSNDQMCKKIFFIAHREAVDTASLKASYPELKDKISESAQDDTGTGINMKGKTYVWTIQFMRTYSFQKRQARDPGTGDTYLHTVEEIEAMKQKLKDQFVGLYPPDDTFAIVYRAFGNIAMDNYSTAEFNEYIDSEAFLSQTLEISQKSVRDDDDNWFQVIMTQDNVVLPQPSAHLDEDGQITTTNMRDIGASSPYNFIPGIKRDGSIYPFGVAWFNADMLELKTLFMTTLSIMVMKANKPQPVYEKGSLLNEEEFMTGWWRIDVPAVVDQEWRKHHPNLEPFKYKAAIFDKQAFTALDQFATETIKSQEGAVDALRGVQSYNQQSGVQTAQLQSAAQTYMKIDEIYIHQYLKRVGDSLLANIVRYRRHPHPMIDYDETGMSIPVVVNASPDAMYDQTKYYIKPIVEPSPEIQKQIDMQNAEKLFSQGLMHPLDYIKTTGVKNPEKVFSRSQIYQQLMQAYQMLAQQQQMAGGQNGGGQLANPDAAIMNAENKKQAAMANQ